jgi:STE24 endopeptidase
LGGFNALDFYAASFTEAGTLTHSVLFTVFVGLYFGVVGLPFRIYSVFVIEERHGFNKTTLTTFIVDLIKGLLLSFILGLPILYLLYWFMHTAGNTWWFYAWAALTSFQILIAAVFPTFLAPIFNKFTPLADQELNDRIVELARRIRFKMTGVFTVDGSRRSGHSNAYFAGMGRFRRIVLFDTLMKQLTSDELIAVLAHEMGHNVKKHIVKSMLLSAALSLVGFYVLSLLITWSDFYTAFNVAKASPHTALVIFSITSETFTFFLTPIMNLWSRKNEFEADRFSIETTGSKAAMKNALVKLTEENLSNLAPHPAYSFYHYSHPTTPERARAIDKH